MEERIQEKIRDIEHRLEVVQDNLPDDLDAFLSMGLERDGLYKNIEIAIQDCFDICALIVKAETMTIPDDEVGFPEALSDADIISTETASRLRDMKGFRNALAHRYGDIDHEIAYRNIADGIEDFDRFLDEIRAYLG